MIYAEYLAVAQYVFKIFLFFYFKNETKCKLLAPMIYASPDEIVGRKSLTSR